MLKWQRSEIELKQFVIQETLVNEGKCDLMLRGLLLCV